MIHTTAPDKPAVALPAPLYFALSVVAGYGLSRIWPIALQTGPVQFYAGWVVHGFAAILILWCFALFIRRRTTIMPRNPVQALVTDGPYRFSRNPMYVSLALFHLGIALNTGNLWQLPAFLLHLVAVRYWVIKPEEAYMQARFGSRYGNYCRRVRRWL